MIAYVDTYRDRFGVETICRVLGGTDGGFVTARGYRAATTRPLSARAVRDARLSTELWRGHAENFSVYGRGRCRSRWLVPGIRWVGIRPHG